MSKLVFFFGDGRAEGDPKRRDLLGGKGAGLAEMTSLGLPVPPGFTIATERLQRVLRATRQIPDRGARTRSTRRSRASRRRMGARLGDADGAAPRERPLGRARVDARDDGHHPQPRPERRRRRGARQRSTQNPRFAFDAYRRFIAMYASVALGVSKRALRARARRRARHASPRRRGIDRTRLNAEELKRKRARLASSPPRSSRALVAAFKAHREEGDRDATSRRPAASSSGGAIERRLPLVVQPPRRRLPPHARHPRRLGHRVQRAGDGLRQPRATRSATGVAFTRDPSTGEQQLFGEWLPNAQGEDVVAGIRTPLPICAAATRGDADELARGARCPRPTAELDRHRREAREALPRHAGPRVHHPGRQALHAPVPRGEAHRPRGRAHRRRDGARRGSSPRRRRSSASTRPAIDQLLHPTHRPERAEEAPRARPPREPRRRERRTSSSAPTRPSAAPGRASRSSWCASRPRPRTSTG